MSVMGDYNLSDEEADIVKQLLMNITSAACHRLDNIDERLQDVCSRTWLIENHINLLWSHTPRNAFSPSPSRHLIKTSLSNHQQSTATIDSWGGENHTDQAAWIQQQNRLDLVSSGSLCKQHQLGKTIKQEQDTGEHQHENEFESDGITFIDLLSAVDVNNGVDIILNAEGDFPDGSWLGDENNPSKRVRVPISPANMAHIHSRPACQTPVKMALVLLDYLFDHDTLATSNLSGTGRQHCRHQLDPLIIYGIQCHLEKYFGITNEEWQRIRLNIDTKCRSAHRSKSRRKALQHHSHSSPEADQSDGDTFSHEPMPHEIDAAEANDICSEADANTTSGLSHPLDE